MSNTEQTKLKLRTMRNRLRTRIIVSRLRRDAAELLACTDLEKHEVARGFLSMAKRLALSLRSK